MLLSEIVPESKKGRWTKQRLLLLHNRELNFFLQTFHLHVGVYIWFWDNTTLLLPSTDLFHYIFEGNSYLELMWIYFKEYDCDIGLWKNKKNPTRSTSNPLTTSWEVQGFPHSHFRYMQVVLAYVCCCFLGKKLVELVTIIRYFSCNLK